MPSRKRAKAKERRLKNQAQGAVQQEQDISHLREPHTQNNNDQRGDNKDDDINHCDDQVIYNTCKHGYIYIPSKHPVQDFMNTFTKEINRDNHYMLDIMSLTYENHPNVWKNPVMRKIAIKALLSFGTEFILRGSCAAGICAKELATAIIILEKYNGGEGVGSVWLEDYGYLDRAGERDMLYFFKKRIPCSCLKEKYSEIRKSQDRGSQCFQCEETVNRKVLMTCARCKFAIYCSRDCQIADWPSHKHLCRELSSFHKHVKKIDNATRI